MVHPVISEVLASTSNTLTMIRRFPAPIAFAASITPGSTSFMEDSTIRAINGIAATTSGTIVAVDPVLFPIKNLVNGINRISKIRNGTLRTILAVTSSTLYNHRFGASPSLSDTANSTPMGRPNRYPRAVDIRVIYNVSPIPFQIICMISGVHTIF